MMSQLNTPKAPSYFDAFFPLLVLISLLSASVYLFGNDSSSGPNQIALLLAAGAALIIGLKNGYAWKELEKAMINGISLSLGAVLILLVVGSLIGTWLLSGTVPTLIYYGLQLINPSWFYPAACVLCAVVAMSIGSSWTTAATIGVALMGVGGGMGLSAPITAGAVISGAYFGDKLSPLSETTNLAPAVAGSDLFTHIHHMLWTTVPSFILAVILFTFLGLSEDVAVQSGKIAQYSVVLKQTFNISILMLIPLMVLLTMAIKKVPAFPAVFIGSLLGCVWAVFFQQDLMTTLNQGDASAVAQLKLIWNTMHSGVVITTNDANLTDLLSGGGMKKMLNTIWLIICALSFGAVMEKVGLLRKFVNMILKASKSTGSLITSTILTCIGTNLIAADQYMAIVMPGRMYKEEFARRGLDPVNLSRTLEDGGTITSPLIPWNTCGAYMHGVLMVNPLDYMFYCFFNLINPVLAIIYAYLGVKILRLTPPTQPSDDLKKAESFA
jgi:NhaC family Na+:H+ antiporter